MKTLHVFLCLLLSVSVVKSQNAYMDAVQILKINNDDLNEVLAEFDTTTNTGQQMHNLKLFIDNPFDPNVRSFDADVFTVYNRAIDELNRPDLEHPNGRVNLLEKITKTAASPTSGASEFAVQTFSALSAIIIDRAKAELTVAYFDRLKTMLDETELQFGQKKAKLKNLFPRSFQQLSTLNLIDYHSTSQLIQNAFKQDLVDLPENMHNHLIPDVIKADLSYRLFHIGSSFAKNVQDGSSLPDAFKEITSFTDDAAYKDIAPIIKLVTILSENLRVPDDVDRRYWITRGELFNLGPDGQKYLIGLIYLRNRDVFNSFLGKVNAVRLYEQRQTFIDFISLLEDLDRTFSADMLNAKTAEEKQKVLDDVISPPTTYRTKRLYAKSSYINSYMGLSGGLEWLSKADSWGRHSGLFVPVGIELARATKKGHSNSFLFSVIDLGTMVSYRISNSTDSDGIPEDFKLKSIAAPGLFYVHGFSKSPISFGLGGQFVGDLRKVDDERNSAVQLTAFLAVDIPLFQISAKQN